MRNIRRRSLRYGGLAFCMLLVCVVAIPNATAATESANIARYNHRQVWAGATDLPVPARVLYWQATGALKQGDRDGAIQLLERSTQMDPDYADPYFTLARIRLAQFDFEGFLLLSQGLASLWHNFGSQSLAVLNAAAIMPYVLVIVALIIGLALTIKYLPFAAHKLQEQLRGRMKATGARLTAYLLLLVPFLILPGPIMMLAYVTLLCWLFMLKRERFVLLVVTGPLILAGLLGSQLSMLTPVADPNSLTSLVARANHSGVDPVLGRSLDNKRVEGLESERLMALGLLAQRAGSYRTAAGHFRGAIANRPEQAMGYVNLGNVYFLQERYEKALEGYRKAESIDPNDAVTQFNLAQAFIKTMLMKESSKSYQRALALGVEHHKAQYATETLNFMQVLPRTYTNAELWSIARVEGQTGSTFLDGLLFPVGRFGHKASAWLLLGAVLSALMLSFVIKRHRLTFQCSNCAKLTCSACCNSDRDIVICTDCHGVIATVTSEKVIEALLRQKRQAAVVARRRSARFVTGILPGIRDIYFGQVFRGFKLTTLFSLSLVLLVSRGYIMKDPSALDLGVPLWKFILPAAGLAIAFLMSFFGKQQMNFRPHRNQMHMKETGGDASTGARVA